jgi:hypothetical protein
VTKGFRRATLLDDDSSAQYILFSLLIAALFNAYKMRCSHERWLDSLCASQGLVCYGK